MGISPIMNIITVIFLRLSKIAYTKFSAVPAGGMLVRQSRFDDVVLALCDIPFPLPADAVEHLFVERHCDGIATDQDRKYDRPFEPVDGIVGKHRDESLLDTQFQHLPRQCRYISCAHHTIFGGTPQGRMRFLIMRCKV